MFVSKKEMLFAPTWQTILPFFLVKGELDQILCGLSETLSVLDLIRTDPIMHCLQVATVREAFNLSRCYFGYVHPVYFPQGSNSREQEETVVMKWFHFLHCI